MSLTPGIAVPRHLGETARRRLIELGLFDKSRRATSDSEEVFLPVLAEPAAIDIPFRTVQMEFTSDRRRLTAEDLLGRPVSFEVIGDIAILEDPQTEAAAQALQKAHKTIKVVLAAESEVEGEFRTRRFCKLAGEDRTWTVHRENGLALAVDLEKAYFTPRLGTERKRVADQVRPGDMVLDMFAGVGPFALLMARRGGRVVAIDKNPSAIKLLRDNAAKNRLELEILEGDAGLLAGAFAGKARHIVMNLPHSSARFLPAAIAAAAPGGVIHYYAFAPEDDLYRDAKAANAAAQDLGREIEVLYRGVVRSYSPHWFNIVLDLQIAMG
ncbi:MAG: tRNA (guanine(37)-N1)-methyltransferase Trm5b [Methanosaeta sp. PtaB.Bin039]|nr:MAG: tRNA (guanine(37)-N1)-methyltransferase Trm5b [Methanosaeta sp. PtaB.Bin039]